MRNYNQLLDFLGERDHRTVPSIRATAVHIAPREENTGMHDIAVSYHGTKVVTAHADGTFTLNSGGYRTPTTKDRINEYSPARVWQERGVWYLAGRNQDGSLDWSKAGRVKFFDGIRVDASGVPVSHQTEEDHELYGADAGRIQADRRAEDVPE